MKPVFVVLTDLSAAAEAALACTARLAARLHGKLVLLHAYLDINPLRDPEELMLTTAAELAGEQEVREDLQRQARQQPVPAAVELSLAPLATTVAEAVTDHQPLLLALGRTAAPNRLRRWLPHRVLPVLRAAHYPLLLVPEGWTAPELPTRIVVAADSHPFWLSTAAMALKELLVALQASTCVVHVAPELHGPSHADEALQAVRRTGLFGRLSSNSLYEVREESPTDGILHAAAEVQAHLLVLFARPHTFLGELFHRSVTAQVLHRSPVPVLVLPTVA